METPRPLRFRTSNKFLLIGAPLVGLLAATAYASGWLSSPPRGPVSATTAAARRPQKSSHKSRARNLALYPAAQSFSRRVGQRFVKAGREISEIVGELTVDGERKRVRIVRKQEDGGERVDVSLEGTQETLSWDAELGPLSSDARVEGTKRELLERLVMDSPDQFALAQLRGASYYTIARAARPTTDDGVSGYAGPLYDIVRVGEPRQEGGNEWDSAWRLYYINTASGLIEKVVSLEDSGATVEAVLSEWGIHAGETLPARVTWSRGGQMFMQLAIRNVGHGPKQ